MARVDTPPASHWPSWPPVFTSRPLLAVVLILSVQTTLAQYAPMVGVLVGVRVGGARVAVPVGDGTAGVGVTVGGAVGEGVCARAVTVASGQEWRVSVWLVVPS